MHDRNGDDGQDPKEKINYRATFRLLLGFILPERRGFAAAFVWLLFSTAFNLLTPIIAKHIFDKAIPSGDTSLLALSAAALFFNSVLFLVTNYFLRMRLVKTGQQIMTDLKKRMLAHMLALDLPFYAEYPVGRLTARVQADTTTLYELFTETTVNIFRDILMFAVTFGIMFYFSPKLTLLLCAAFPVVLVISSIFLRKSSTLFVTVRKLASEITGFLTEHVNAAGLLQAFNRERMTEARLEDINKRKFDTELKAEMMMIVFFMSIIMISPVSIAMILGVGGAWVAEGTLTVGTLVMFILYIDKLFEPVFSVSEHVSIIQRSFAAGHRIQKILERKPAITDPPQPRFLHGIKEGLEFRNVWMRYADDAQWVLKDISFTLPKGRSLAIVGETGGGKTTVTNLLFKFYVPNKGKILIDNTDLAEIGLNSLRTSIGLVQQDIYLFPGTIMQNLKLMDDSIPDAMVHDAIRTVGLEAFFKKHGLNKHITDKGANLSAGEKQVIALARAMVLNQEVLVFDEATSHIDPYTERLINAAMQRLLKQKTMIIIAHRLSTIRNADQILLVSEGEIKEKGTHEELLERGGTYSRFYKLQFGEGAK
ncbi:MAG: ABC transporter ATP-binding protein/permease [Elusimicrobiales bacterium]|nr:ABC transporter ATP-binding protein/permease [Elusimicrobiales bacterium]